GITSPWKNLSAPDHAIRQMVKAELNVTINSDDPPMFNTDLANEYVRCGTEMRLTPTELKSCALNGIRASWLDDGRKRDWLMAWAYVGPVSDEGWTWSHNQGLLAVKEAFPKIKTLEVESVPYSADATRIFRQFVSDGANIVFDSSNYGDLLYAASDAAPEVAW